MKKMLKKITTVVLSLLLVLNFSCTCFAEPVSKSQVKNNEKLLTQKVKEGNYELEVKPETNNNSDDGLIRVKLNKDTNDKHYLILKPNMFFTSDGERGTHQFITGQAIKILKNDKGEDVQKVIKEYESVLREYCDKPDKDEKDYAFAYHFYNPYTGENYLPSFMKHSKITALTKFKEHAINAVNNYKSNKNFAMQELGRACHFLEDVNVPHHAANLVAVLSSHTQYEKFVQDHQQNYAINTSDKYDNYSSLLFEDYCDSILKDCAKYAYSFKDTVEDDKNSWDSVADKTVKYAQQYAAAFFYRFLQEVGEA